MRRHHDGAILTVFHHIYFVVQQSGIDVVERGSQHFALRWQQVGWYGFEEIRFCDAGLGVGLGTDEVWAIPFVYQFHVIIKLIGCGTELIDFGLRSRKSVAVAHFGLLSFRCFRLVEHEGAGIHHQSYSQKPQNIESTFHNQK